MQWFDVVLKNYEVTMAITNNTTNRNMCQKQKIFINDLLTPFPFQNNPECKASGLFMKLSISKWCIGGLLIITTTTDVDGGIYIFPCSLYLWTWLLYFLNVCICLLIIFHLQWRVWMVFLITFRWVQLFRSFLSLCCLFSVVLHHGGKKRYSVLIM